MIYTTELGSKYKIDPENKTWERLVVEGDKDDPIRTPTGTFLKMWNDQVGERLLLLCPPLIEGAIARLLWLAETIAIED